MTSQIVYAEDGHTSEMQRFKNLYMELITNGKMLLNIDQTQGSLKTITYTNIVLCHVTYVVCYKYIIARVEGAYWLSYRHALEQFTIS